MKREIFDTNKVYINACRGYDVPRLSEIINNMLDGIAAENNMEIQGKRVTVKPNLLAKRTPDAGVTTSPLFVEIVSEYFVKRGAKVTIADSPGGIYTYGTLKAIYKATGMEEAAKASGAALNFDMESRLVAAKGKGIKGFHIISPVADCDILVNVCRLKTHALCEMTAAVKNIFGVIPGLTKAEMHARYPVREDFAAMLVDLCRTAAPAVNIVDAVVCMEGNGPAGGTLKKVGCVIGGANPFAVDTLCAEIMGYKNSEMGTLEAANRAGVGFPCAGALEIAGEDYRPFVSEFKRPDGTAGGLLKQFPRLLGGKIGKIFEPRPYINKKKCVGCGECARCCPVSDIRIVQGKAVIKRKKCIKCYCCQELCPKKAVEIR